MTEYICNFCNNKFFSLNNLDKHKKTAKYCLELQKKDISNNFKDNSIYKCDFCNKEFLRKDSLNTHLLRCKTKIKNQTENKEKEYINYIKLVEQYKIKYECIEKLNKEYFNTIIDQKIRINDLESQIKNLYDTNSSLKSNID